MRLQADLDIIAEGELKAAPHDDNRRNGLYRRQSGTGHILREANGFADVTSHRMSLFGHAQLSRR